MKSISISKLVRPNIFSKGRSRFSTATSTVETENFFVFPRETEGNTYAVNWSLVGDGVTPVHEAFRDARVNLLTSKLPAKPAAGKVELSKPSYFGDYKMQEAGDASLSMISFSEMSNAHKLKLSNEKNLFVEDASLGSFSCVRVGVRVISDDPAFSLISRALLIPIPPRPCNHRARFDGWNLDPRAGDPGKFWDGSKFVFVENPAPSKGLRPIVAFIGGVSETIAVEFIQQNSKLAGANIIIGGKAPVRGIISAVGHAATVLVNEQASSLALPSASFTKDKSTCVIVGADDSIVDALYANKSLYGAYNNVLTSDGVSACWNGIIGNATASSTSAPAVVVGGKSTISVNPDNISNVATHIAFFEKGGKKSSLSEEEAVKRIVAIVGPSKAELAAKLIKGTKIFTVGSAADVSTIL